MSINIPVPQNLDYPLYQFLTEFLRRSADFSINPAQINVSININTGDLNITTSSNGIVFTSSSGKTWRLNVQEQTGEDGSTYAVPLLTRVT